MPEVFDPYAEWLGIGASQRPPTNYQLLGVAAFESDVAEIAVAAAARKERVQAQLKGSRVALARRMLAELTMAESCLLDPNSKAAYDEHLGAQGTASDDPYSLVPEKKAPSASKLKISPVVVADFGAEKLADLSASKIDSLDDFYQENLPNRPALKELPPQSMLAGAASARVIRRWLLVGSAAVVGLGVLFGLVYFLIIATSPANQAVADARSTPQSNPDANPQVASPGGPIVQFVPRPQAAPTAPAVPRRSLTTSNVIVPSGPTILPKSFVLPPIEVNKPATIGKLPFKSDSIVDLKLADPSAGEEKVAEKFLVQPNVLEGDMSRWSLRAPSKVALTTTQSSDGRVVAARLSLDQQGELEFEWLPEASETELAALDNCSLRVTIDGQTYSVILQLPSPSR